MKLGSREKQLLDAGVAYQALNSSYEKQKYNKLLAEIENEAHKQDHRVWYAFHPSGKQSNETDNRAQLIYDLFYKEAWLKNMYLKEIMLIDLLKMGNKKRYTIELDVDFITIPDFYTPAYDDYDKFEVPSVLRWMRFISDRYGVGFALYCDTYDMSDLSKLFMCDVQHRYSNYFCEIPVTAGE